jgi:transglutaminase-like putative cysteine protease
LSSVDKPDSANKEKVADEFGATFDGNSYKVDSYINTVGLTQLRSASGITPSWIQNRYLALPASLPDRVRQLAIKLTENQLSEYDQAAAIESYLRTITYTVDLPFPPSDRDVVDYFLFDLKRGYCDYYASAMVVMARAIGLPARLITGYATGIYDPVNARYIVTEANAHSWVEVYLAGIGWVEFEPTGGLRAITRLNEPANHVEIPQISQVQHFNLYKWFRTINQNWLAILGGMIGTLLFGMVLWVGSDRWRLRHLSPPMTILQLYRRLYRSGQRLAEQFQIGDTPDEYAIRLKLRLKMLGLAHRWNFYFQRGIEETARLTNLYTQVVYSPHAPALDDQKTAINIWFHLRMRLWLAANLGILNQLSSKIKSVIKR